MLLAQTLNIHLNIRIFYTIFFILVFLYSFPNPNPSLFELWFHCDLDWNWIISIKILTSHKFHAGLKQNILHELKWITTWKQRFIVEDNFIGMVKQFPYDHSKLHIKMIIQVLHDPW